MRLQLAELDTPIILIFSEQQVDVLNAWNDIADCTIDTNITTLLFLDYSNHQHVTQFLKLTQGDQQILQQFVTLLKIVGWDPAELLVPWLGDIVTEVILRYFIHQVYGIKQQLRTFQDRITFAITDEWRIAPSSLELTFFNQKVNEVTLAVEQLAACLDKL
ncbi:Protein YigP [Candidatus Palibaumannia cicadellinicola]|uniref:Protein YigP n=1 Tax=Candidatus Palibaumannia cicadellinicola TaxID=186490 RepID=A0A088N9V4_9GAMM|nr:Protein YigP [Candidatus Baumannia cicadellinicola]